MTMRVATIFYKGKPYIYPGIDGFEIEVDDGEQFELDCFVNEDGRQVYRFGEKLYEGE